MGVATFNSYTDNVKETLVLAPATVTGNGTDTASTSIDLRGYGAGGFAVCIGNSADTLSGSIKIEVEVQHSDESAANFTAAPDADVLTTVTGTNTGTVAVIDAPAEDIVLVDAQYTGTKRYARINLNLTGNHANGTPCCIVGRRWRATYSPVT